MVRDFFAAAFFFGDDDAGAEAVSAILSWTCALRDARCYTELGRPAQWPIYITF